MIFPQAFSEDRASSYFTGEIKIESRCLQAPYGGAESRKERTSRGHARKSTRLEALLQLLRVLQGLYSQTTSVQKSLEGLRTSLGNKHLLTLEETLFQLVPERRLLTVRSASTTHLQQADRLLRARTQSRERKRGQLIFPQAKYIQFHAPTRLLTQREENITLDITNCFLTIVYCYF